MDIMVGSVVLEEDMKDVARQPKTTVIINGLDHGKTEEDHSCSCSHS